jgi:glycosyltransferase involved in cell wall biosynthesis
LPKQFVFAVPGNLETPTGGYVYDRRIISELRAQGWQIDICNLSERFPDPDISTLVSTYTTLASLPPGVPVVIDGLALGALGDIGQHLRNNPLIALVHHPLALETGLMPARVAALRVSEYQALAAARHVIVTSNTTAAILATDYGIDDALITVAPPGSDPAPPAKGSADGIVNLLSVGAVTRRKGHDLLIAALAVLKDLPWRLTIVGDLTRDAAAAAHLSNTISYVGLADRVRLAGAVSESDLAQAYHEADVFVLASYYEGYGMVFAEALARGLPVIGTTGGAIPEAVPKGAGILVPPGNMPALVDALRELITQPDKRAQHAAEAKRAATLLPNWTHTAELFAQAIESVES